MHLHLFMCHCYPSWSDIFAMTNRIMLELSTNDFEFYHHLKTVSKIRRKLNPKVFIFSSNESIKIIFLFSKDFIPEILSLEPKQTIQYSHESTSDPILFLRKWINQVNKKIYLPNHHYFQSDVCRYTSFEFCSVLLGSIFYDKMGYRLY
jgi:hypothetical protein